MTREISRIRQVVGNQPNIPALFHNCIVDSHLEQLLGVAVLLAQGLPNCVTKKGKTETGPMMRITLVSQTPQEAVLRLEGWVAGEEVELLEAEGYRCFQETHRLVLDLSGVKFIDPAGLALLQGWSGPRLELRGASAYLRSVLETEGLTPN